MRSLLPALSKPIVVAQFQEIHSEKTFRESKRPELAWPWLHHRGLLGNLRLDRQAPVVPPQEPADTGSARIRPPGQEGVYPPLSGERGLSRTRSRPLCA